jgi:hypothetical protein
VNAHVAEQIPEEQNGAVVAQTLPQVPQFIASDWLFTQPLLQAARGAAHAQAEAWQLVPAAQTLPQIPQLASSVAESTQVAPQAIEVAPSAEQLQAPFTHC